MRFTTILDETRNAFGGMADFATGLVSPTLRIGVTGLSRAGKTVFITALVHNLVHGGRLPLFAAQSRGLVRRAYLEPQPDDALPRFAYEDHVEALTGPDRRWPESTRRRSQLRLTVEYDGAGLIARNLQGSRFHIDIVDYPGEWLLDLPLLDLSYAEWSAATVAASRAGARAPLAADWHAHLAGLDPTAPADEAAAQAAAALFTAYLARCRAEEVSLSSLPPGRFLMPGDLAGSPLLTFAPLDLAPDAAAARASLHAMMERRYAAYVTRVVKPFFYDHFARLDRQIVLVDALAALNAGPEAVADLRTALAGVLACFRQGANSIASALFGRRADRILFAATKADLLHHESHDRLEAILGLLVEDAVKRAAFAGARIDVAAIAAVRATREARVSHAGEELACIAGVPEAGQTLDGEVFDGDTEAAIFPGDLPADPAAALDGSLAGALRFIRFRPPLRLAPAEPGAAASFPHIRLDRAAEFLIGDRFG